MILLAISSEWLAREASPTALIPPLIPYNAKKIDRDYIGCVSPFAVQEGKNWYFRHWLGTDDIGRDVAAGLLVGLKNALLVGVFATLWATFIALLIGLTAGFWGNQRLKISFFALLLRGVACALTLFWSIQFFKIAEKKMYDYLVISILMLSCWLFVSLLLSLVRRFVPFLARKRILPIDAILMRFIEFMQAIPSILVILAISAAIPERSFFSVIILLGLLSWSATARLVRNATLQLQNSDFVMAARVLGLNDWQVIIRHILPNIMPILWVNIAFGVANAISSEAVLSFLGFGIPLEEVTWGGMLHTVRHIPSAWWLAVTAGLSLFGTIRYFEAIGNYFSTNK